MSAHASPSPTLAEIDAHLAADQNSGDKTFPAPDIFSRFLVLEGLTHWFFRLGFASIFLVNAVYAVLDPDSFTNLLQANPIASAIGFVDFMVRVAMVNDLLLGIFIIAGWRKRLVYGWAGAWLLLVAGLKLMNLIA